MSTFVVKMFENLTGGYTYTGSSGKTYSASDSLAGLGVEFRVPSQYNRGAQFSLTYMDANSVGREVTNGPVSQGAKAWLAAQATCIYAGPRRPEPKVVDAKPGDLIVCPELDVVFRVTAGSRWEDPSAEVVTAPAATEDFSELVAGVNAQPKAYRSESYYSS